MPMPINGCARTRAPGGAPHLQPFAHGTAGVVPMIESGHFRGDRLEARRHLVAHAERGGRRRSRTPRRPAAGLTASGRCAAHAAAPAARKSAQKPATGRGSGSAARHTCQAPWRAMCSSRSPRLVRGAQELRQRHRGKSQQDGGQLDRRRGAAVEPVRAIDRPARGAARCRRAERDRGHAESSPDQAHLQRQAEARPPSPETSRMCAGRSSGRQPR